MKKDRLHRAILKKKDEIDKKSLKCRIAHLIQFEVYNRLTRILNFKEQIISMTNRISFRCSVISAISESRSKYKHAEKSNTFVLLYIWSVQQCTSTM